MTAVIDNNFAATSAAIARLERVTYDVAKLNHDNWRQSGREFYWRLVIPVRVETMDLSDQELAIAMMTAAKELLEGRIESFTPDDGVERVVRKSGRPKGVKLNDFVLDGRTREARAKIAMDKRLSAAKTGVVS